MEATPSSALDWVLDKSVVLGYSAIGAEGLRILSTVAGGGGPATRLPARSRVAPWWSQEAVEA